MHEISISSVWKNVMKTNSTNVFEIAFEVTRSSHVCNCVLDVCLCVYSGCMECMYATKVVIIITEYNVFDWLDLFLKLSNQSRRKKKQMTIYLTNLLLASRRITLLIPQKRRQAQWFA